MNHPPFEIDNARVLYYAEIPPGTWEGRTRHVIGNEPAPDPAGLAICQYEGSSEVYLFYCTSDWSATTDTLHESVAAAMSQAEYECGQEVEFYDAAA